jgi:hypothetical protein
MIYNPKFMVHNIHTTYNIQHMSVKSFRYMMGTIMKFVINMEGLDADLEFCSMGTIMKFVINMEGLDADLERI